MPLPRSTRGAGLVLACLLVVTAGCADPRANAARTDPTVARRQVTGRPAVQPVDQSGPVVMNDLQAPQGPYGGRTSGTSGAISATVNDSVRSARDEGLAGGSGRLPGAAAAGPGATGPFATGGAGPSTATVRDAAPPPGAAGRGPGPGDAPDTTGGFQLIGTVLAEVHDTPVFADKVLATVDKELAAQAKQLDERQFRAAAAYTIQNQIKEFIYTELEYAMALRQLDKRDQELARLATIKWRDEQIVKAGGSLEVARQRAAAAGYDFDEMQEDQYRLFMRKLYYEKREYPKIQVTASDIRKYYRDHVAEFTTPARARFRVIKVDPRKRGGRQEALGEINRLLDRARSGGKDFAALAAEENDEESFKQPVDWFQRNSFVVKEVEDAVWKLEPGKITDVIETPDAFYIARLDAKEAGRVRPFEEPDVQRQIELTLRKRQFDVLRSKVQQTLINDAIIRYHPRMIELAVEMAMQKYRYWRQAAAQ